MSPSLPPLLSLLLPSPFPSPSKLPTCALLSGITFVLATAPHHRTTLAGSPSGPPPTYTQFETHGDPASSLPTTGSLFT